MNGSAVPSPSLADMARLAESTVFASLQGSTPTSPAAAAPLPPPVAPAGPPPPSPWAYEPPPDFQAIPQDFLLYHPDYCGDRAIYGLLVDAFPLVFQRRSTDGTAEPAIHALVFQLLEETLVLDPDRFAPTGATRLPTVVAPAGSEIIVGADNITLRRLVRAALDKRMAAEVWIRPDPAARLAYGAADLRAWVTRSGKMFPREQIKRVGR